jgi:hypothetical protein
MRHGDVSHGLQHFSHGEVASSVVNWRCRAEQTCLTGRLGLWWVKAGAAVERCITIIVHAWGERRVEAMQCPLPTAQVQQKCTSFMLALGRTQLQRFFPRRILPISPTTPKLAPFEQRRLLACSGLHLFHPPVQREPIYCLKLQTRPRISAMD